MCKRPSACGDETHPSAPARHGLRSAGRWSRTPSTASVPRTPAMSDWPLSAHGGRRGSVGAPTGVGDRSEGGAGHWRGWCWLGRRALEAGISGPDPVVAGVVSPFGQALHPRTSSQSSLEWAGCCATPVVMGHHCLLAIQARTRSRSDSVFSARSSALANLATREVEPSPSSSPVGSGRLAPVWNISATCWTERG